MNITNVLKDHNLVGNSGKQKKHLLGYKMNSIGYYKNLPYEPVRMLPNSKILVYNNPDGKYGILDMKTDQVEYPNYNELNGVSGSTFRGDSIYYKGYIYLLTTNGILYKYSANMELVVMIDFKSQGIAGLFFSETDNRIFVHEAYNQKKIYEWDGETNKVTSYDSTISTNRSYQNTFVEGDYLYTVENWVSSGDKNFSTTTRNYKTGEIIQQVLQNKPASYYNTYYMHKMKQNEVVIIAVDSERKGIFYNFSYKNWSNMFYKIPNDTPNLYIYKDVLKTALIFDDVSGEPRYCLNNADFTREFIYPTDIKITSDYLGTGLKISFTKDKLLAIDTYTSTFKTYNLILN